MSQGRNKMSKRPRNSRQHFLTTYLEYYKAGKSREELAEALGMQLSSLYHRVHVERTKGHQLPLIPLAEQLANSEEIDSALAELESLATGKPVKRMASVDVEEDEEPEYEGSSDSEEVADLDDIEQLLNG